MQTIPGNEFEMWIRRAQKDPERFDIKFRAHQGKGLLRIPFVGGAESTPASEQGGRASITADELISSQFFMLCSGGTGTTTPSRVEYMFNSNTSQR